MLLQTSKNESVGVRLGIRSVRFNSNAVLSFTPPTLLKIGLRIPINFDSIANLVFVSPLFRFSLGDSFIVARSLLETWQVGFLTHSTSIFVDSNNARMSY